MAEEITQRLGFDAARAIAELRKLQAELNKFKQGLQSTSGALRKFPSKAQPAIKAFRELANAANQAKTAVQGLGKAGTVPANVATSAKTAGAAMGNLGQQAKTAGQKVETAVTKSFNTGAKAATNLANATKQAAKTTKQAAATTAAAASKTESALQNAGTAGQRAAKAITLSWKTVIRVVQAQLIVRAISTVISTFTEAQTAAAEFSQRIGEIATISTGAIGSLDDISDSVLSLSRSLGLAADEVAEGLYQTLSNQVVDAGDALRFEEQAAKLSIATHAELRDAVNALSSVMNSYSLDVSEVEQVSDVLFKTIELGRLRLGEFGDVLGRVAPLTEALGISYQEMAAALAALTQKGIPAHTAITQLTQVSQKLLRPTTKLQELYHEWGVETGPEAIKRFGGLQGVLVKMKDATAGNDKEFADLLGRVRAMVGALNLTSNEANALTEALQAMEESAGASEKAFQTMEETIGRRAVKAWNDLKVTVIEFGKNLLELTTPMIEALSFLIKNFDYVAAAMVAIGGAALVMSGHFAISTVSVAGLTGAVWGLGAAFLSLLPVLIAVGVALATVWAVKALQDSLDKSTELTELHKQQAEALTQSQEEQSKRRIDSTRKEFEARRKLTGEFFSGVTKEYRKHFELIEASSKAVGKSLDSTLSSLTDKRKKALAIIKEAGLDLDSAIKDSMEEVAETQVAIAEDAFKRELRHMDARQQLWAEIERAQDTAAKAREGYVDAGADEEATRAARELSHLAEKRAKEAVAHAEELGNYGDIKRAEAELDKIRSDRIRGETEFQLERKKLQSDTYKERIQQLEDEGNKLEELIKKVRELSDPLTSEGVLKALEHRRADAERIAELAPEIEKQMDAAFDFSMYDKLDVAESMAKVKVDLQAALSKARIDWDKILAEFEQKLTAKTYTASVKLHIENEHIIQEFVERFGEIDPLGDPGKLGSQMEEILEGVVDKYEGLQEKIDQGNQKALTSVEQTLARLQNDQWFTWWNDFSDKIGSGADKIADAYAKATGSSDEYLEATYRQLPAAEQLRIKLALAAGTIKQAVNEQRRLTAAEAESINAALQYAKAVEQAGELTQNQINQGIAAWGSISEAAEAAGVAAQAYQEQAEIPPGTYENALNSLEEMRQKAKEAAEGQSEITAEASEIKGELKQAKQAVIELPGAAAQAQAALASETDQARQLKIELQGAAQAQKELAQTQAQQPGGAAGPEQPAPPERTTEELEAQAEAARQLTNELVAVDNQFSAVLQSIDSVTVAMVGTSEMAALIAGSMDQAVISVGNLQAGFGVITEQIGLSVESMANLNTSLDIATTAIDVASFAAANWADQLNNCATAGYSAATAMQAAATAAKSAAAACAAAAAACSGGSVGAHHGGPAVHYRQAGGFSPRGQDRIPVMAAPGEFIVSAKNARRFASELQAMNAGSEPSYRERGGAVTNIGDVNVSVTSGETTTQTARQIATALRRELRRGTSRLD